MPVATQVVAGYIENNEFQEIFIKILAMGVVKKLGNERPSI